MPITFGGLAGASTAMAMNAAQAQGGQQGLSKAETNALAISNALGDSANEDGGFGAQLVTKTLDRLKTTGGSNHKGSITPTMEDQRNILQMAFQQKGGIVSNSI